jgi:hypothetical protein
MNTPKGKQLVGYRRYTSKEVNTDLLTNYQAKLEVS